MSIKVKFSLLKGEVIISFIGTLLYSFFFVVDYDADGAFHLGLKDIVLLVGIFFVISFVIIFVYFFFLHKILIKLKTQNKIKKYKLISFIVLLCLVFCIASYYMKNVIESLELIVSYGILGLAIINRIKFVEP